MKIGDTSFKHFLNSNFKYEIKRLKIPQKLVYETKNFKYTKLPP